MQPNLSILVSSRVKDNPDSNIDRVISTTLDCLLPDERVEFLIKYDDDDNERPSQEYFLQKYPQLPIRCFCWSRGEGRHATHHVHEYLATRTSYNLLLPMADDCWNTRKGFITDAYNVYEKNKYCMIVGQGPCKVHTTDQPVREGFAGPPPNFYDVRYPDWESMSEEEYIRTINVRYHTIGLTGSIFPREFFEVAQNFGWQTGTDTWATVLECIFYDIYNIKLWHGIDCWYTRGGKTTSGREGRIYNEMQIPTGYKGFDSAYVRLLRQQAKNIYLNMKNEGIV